MTAKTPTGTRDLMSYEVSIKRALKDTIMHTFESYGFEEVMTPAIEYYQTYNQAFSSLQDSSMYKFFDQNGDILTLRMDMTVPIARMVSSKYVRESFPLRLCYCADVYKVKKTFGGHRNEVTDCGVELIGAGRQSDLEILSCAIDTLKAIGLETFVLEIGDISLFRLACQKAGLSAKETARLQHLIDSKALIDLQEFLDGLALDPKARRFFEELPLLSGRRSCLKRAMELCFDEQMEEVVRQLENLYGQLAQLELTDHVYFELSKMPHQNYYTSLIFEGFAPGVGHSILSGGRYDQLLSVFGEDVPACGFSIKLDYLLEIFEPVRKERLIIRYPLARQIDALKLARQYRPEIDVILEEKEDGELEMEKSLWP